MLFACVFFNFALNNRDLFLLFLLSALCLYISLFVLFTSIHVCAHTLFSYVFSSISSRVPKCFRLFSLFRSISPPLAVHVCACAFTVSFMMYIACIYINTTNIEPTDHGHPMMKNTFNTYRVIRTLSHARIRCDRLQSAAVFSCF